jgi:hypothetical protein
MDNRDDYLHDGALHTTLYTISNQLEDKTTGRGIVIVNVCGPYVNQESF